MKRAGELLEGEEFSADGVTWHTCAVNMAAMGTVSVYADATRDDDSPTCRILLQADDVVYIR